MFSGEENADLLRVWAAIEGETPVQFEAVVRAGMEFDAVDIRRRPVVRTVDVERELGIGCKPPIETLLRCKRLLGLELRPERSVADSKRPVFDFAARKQ